jgi:hypothetical protein
MFLTCTIPIGRRLFLFSLITSLRFIFFLQHQ